MKYFWTRGPLAKIAPVFLVLFVIGCADAETTRQHYIVAEYAVAGAADAGTKALNRGTLEPGSEAANRFGEGLDAASATLNEANVQLKAGEIDNASSLLQVVTATLVGIRPLLKGVFGDE